MPSTGEYFELRAGEYANIYANHGRTLRGLYYRLKWYPLLQTHRAVMSDIGPVDGKRILDLGCGVGAYAIDLAVRGARVTAVDASPAMLAHARERAAAAGVGDRVDLIAADGLAWLAAERRAFDVALAIGVFDYVDDPTKWLAELGRQARTLVATFPRQSAFHSLISLRYKQIGVNARTYRIDQLRDWLAGAGYDSVRVTTTTFGGGYLVLASRS